MMAPTDNDLIEPLAVIGMSFKLPHQAVTPQGYWDMLERKICGMTEWPHHRVNMSAFRPTFGEEDKKSFSPGAHFVRRDLRHFDAAFFGISATEARSMDPQQRLAMEVAFQALENAGLPLEDVRGSKTGVYTGSMSHDYEQMLYKDADVIPKYTITGISSNMLANRISWFYDFKGPSVNLDTACSSSLVALDFAGHSLRNRETDMALVLGGNLCISPEGTLSLIDMNMLSQDGKCWSFDERANGYSRGEGFACLIVKRLSTAIQDNNTIRAVIRSTGSNQDGKTPGITQPSKIAQARLIRDCYSRAGLGFEQTRFVEAHGTGTPLGDPTEAEAIGSVFRELRTEESPLYIGSVKSNIGHLEGGAGVAGMIKSILMLEKGMILPNANFATINSRIDAEFLRLQVPEVAVPWPCDGLRRISVNSFGFGGSNSHVILDDALHYMKARGLDGIHNTQADVTHTPSMSGGGSQTSAESSSPKSGSSIETSMTSDSSPTSHDSHNAVNGNVHTLDTTFGNQHDSSKQSSIFIQNLARPLVLSASDEQTLNQLVDIYQSFDPLTSHATLASSLRLVDLAFTLAKKRSHMMWRACAVVGAIPELSDIKKDINYGRRHASKQAPAFVFTGQGAQYMGMGKRLYGYSVYQQSILQMDQIFKDLGSHWSLNDLLTHPIESVDFNDPALSQPLTTALQIALVDFLYTLAIHPVAVIGHSSGEIAAAYASGSIDLRSACRISYHRGRLANHLKYTSDVPGAMMAVNRSEAEAGSYITRMFSEMPSVPLHVACINSLTNVTISGDEKNIDLLKKTLEADGIMVRKLRTGVAYHSPQMTEVANEYHNCLKDLCRNVRHGRTVPMISTLTGNWLEAPEQLQSAEYWVKNMTDQVKFYPAMVSLSQTVRHSQSQKLGSRQVKSFTHLVEVGPHATLRRPIEETLKSLGMAEEVTYVSLLDRQRPADSSFCEAIGRLWCTGMTCDLQALTTDMFQDAQMLVDLPEYPFNHTETHWIESDQSRGSRLRFHNRLELLGVPVPDFNMAEPRWRQIFDPNKSPWILDHVVDGVPIYPASGMLVMAIEAMQQIADRSRLMKGYRFDDVVFSAPIAFSKDKQTESQLSLQSLVRKATVDSDISEFDIRTRSGNDWVQACSGKITLIYQNTAHGLSRRSSVGDGSSLTESSSRSDECKNSISSDDFYRYLEETGMLEYGPSFKALTNISWNGKRTSRGTIHPFRWTTEQSQNSRQPHIAHPVTLDAWGQLMQVALSDGLSHQMPRGVAISGLTSAFIAHTPMAYPECQQLHGSCTYNFRGSRKANASLSLLDDAGFAVGWMQGLTLTYISDTISSNTAPEAKNYCHVIEHRDLDVSPDLRADVQPTTLLIDGNSSLQRAISARLHEQPNVQYQVMDISDLVSRRSGLESIARVTSIVEIDRSFLKILNHEQFETMKTLLSEVKYITWIISASRISERHAESEMIRGLARVVSAERESLRFLTINLEHKGEDIAAWTESIHRTLLTQDSALFSSTEVEWEEHNNRLRVDRATEATNLNEYLQQRLVPSLVPRRIGDSPPLKSVIVNPGTATPLYFVEDTSLLGELQENEVEIHIRAIGLASLHSHSGFQHPGDTVFGLDYSGDVTRIDRSCNTLSVGDRVCTFAPGPLRTVLRCDSQLVARIPDKMSYAEGASFSHAAITIGYSLSEPGTLSESDSILICDGSRVTGQLAIQLAQAAGSEVFTTADSEQMARYLRQAYQIPESHVFDGKDSVFTGSLLSQTGGRGVDIVFGSLSNDTLPAVWKCVAPFGRLIHTSKASMRDNVQLPLGDRPPNISLHLVSANHIAETNPRKARKYLTKMIEMFESGALKSFQFETLPLSSISSLFNSTKGRQSEASIVLEASPESELVVQGVASMPYRFDSNATYVIAGGLGGLGQSISRWMVENGARHLVLLSRSGPSTDELQAFLHDLRNKNAVVRTPTCDISDTVALKEALSLCNSMPPIRGCIQSTMVLRDRLFESMTFDDWTATTRGKVQGSWNLHELLPKDLDFFVMLSSLAGIVGNIGQASYSAANAFMDGLAHHRVSLGMKAASLDFGPITDVGVFARKIEAADIKGAVLDMNEVSEREFLAVMEYYCNPALDLSENTPMVQPLIGLTTPTDFKHRGVEAPRGFRAPMFSELAGFFDSGTHQSAEGTSGELGSLSGNTDSETELGVRFSTAPNDKDAARVVTEGLISRLAKTVSIDISNIESSRPLHSYGVDSLVAVELRNWIGRTFGAELPIFEITGSSPITELSEAIVKRSTTKQDKGS